jgi:outer membrane protein
VNSNSQSLTTNLNASLTLINGFQKVNTIYRNKAEQEASKFDKENTVNNTVLQLTNYFLQILLNKELLKTTEKQVDISDAQLTRAKTQAKSGTLAESGLYEFEAQLASDKASMIQAKNNVAIALLQLKLALQLSDSVDFDIESPSVAENMAVNFETLDASDIYRTAVYNQPSIKSAQAKVASAIFTRKVALGSLSPTISANFSMSDNYFNKATRVVSVVPYVTEPVGFNDQFKNNFSKVVGFNLSLPILAGWSRMNNIANAKIQQQIRTFELDNQKNRLRQDIQQAYNNAKAAQESYVANDKSAAAARKSFDVYQKRFDVGLANTFELQQARTNLLRAESQLIQAKYTYVLDLKILDFYQGKPISLQ